MQCHGPLKIHGPCKITLKLSGVFWLLFFYVKITCFETWNFIWKTFILWMLKNTSITYYLSKLLILRDIVQYMHVPNGNSVCTYLVLKLDEFQIVLHKIEIKKTFSFQIPNLNSGNCISVHCKYIQGIFYTFKLCLVSTVISLYCLHLIAAPSTVEKM